MREEVFNTLTRRLNTQLPVLGAFLLAPLHGLNVLIAAICQCLLLTARQIFRREGEVGKTTAATWIVLLAVLLFVPLSGLFWFSAGLGL